VIAPEYAKTMAAYDRLELAGATDLVPERAQKVVDTFGGRVYASLADALADDDVDTILNLTVQHAHPAVVRACLEAGKHVHTEKPLALTYAEAGALAELAESNGVRLSCAPINFLGEAQQTAAKIVREGTLGPVRVAYAEVNWGRIESWHREPIPFYEVGALYDVGVYPLTLLATIFGPARRATAFSHMVEPERRTLGGETFRLRTPDFVVALVEFEDGPLVRLTANFYVDHRRRQNGIELHGDDGSLHLRSFENFDSPVAVGMRGEEYEDVPLVRDGFPGKDWARSLAELDEAVAEGRPHRPSARLAAHVVEVMEAISRSAQSGEPVEIGSDFERPAPMPWA
jgi:predicted dehydrogenase